MFPSTVRGDTNCHRHRRLVDGGGGWWQARQPQSSPATRIFVALKGPVDLKRQALPLID